MYTYAQEIWLLCGRVDKGGGLKVEGKDRTYGLGDLNAPDSPSFLLVDWTLVATHVLH